VVKKAVVPFNPDGFMVPLRHYVASYIKKLTDIAEQGTELPPFVHHHHHTKSHLQKDTFHERASYMCSDEAFDWRSHYELRHVAHRI
jgi:hypothetical protein